MNFLFSILGINYQKVLDPMIIRTSFFKNFYSKIIYNKFSYLMGLVLFLFLFSCKTSDLIEITDDKPLREDIRKRASLMIVVF